MKTRNNIQTISLCALLITVVGFAYFAQFCLKTKILSADYTQAELEQVRVNYRITEDIISELELIHAATKTRPRPIKVAVTSRRPRHVWRKALSIYASVGEMKIRKGLEKSSASNVATQHIKPTDVHNLLKNLLDEVRSMHGVYNIDMTIATAPLPSYALPMDVYANLNRIAHMIGGIEDRAIKPSHVYQVSVLTVLEIEKIRAVKNITTPIHIPNPSQGKRPRDVYNAVFTLSKKLQMLAEKPGYAIPGGVVLLNKYGGRIIPEDVINMLNNTLADVEEIRFTTGDHSVTSVPLFSKGLTPSNVYDKVNESILLVESFL